MHPEPEYPIDAAKGGCIICGIQHRRDSEAAVLVSDATIDWDGARQDPRVCICLTCATEASWHAGCVSPEQLLAANERAAAAEAALAEADQVADLEENLARAHSYAQSIVGLMRSRRASEDKPRTVKSKAATQENQA